MNKILKNNEKWMQTKHTFFLYVRRQVVRDDIKVVGALKTRQCEIFTSIIGTFVQWSFIQGTLLCKYILLYLTSTIFYYSLAKQIFVLTSSVFFFFFFFFNIYIYVKV